MRYLLILAMLTGCSEPLTNDQIISEVKKCTAAGMSATIYGNGLTLFPTRVYCALKE